MKTTFLTKIRKAFILTTVLLLLVGLTTGMCGTPENGLASLVMTAKAAEAVIKTGTVTADVAVVYNAPYADSAVIGSYAKGAKVEIVQEKAGWGRTDKGWINLACVTMGTTASQTTTSTTTKYANGTVTASVLNIRNDAHINSAVIGTYKKGDRVEILQAQNGWGRTVKGWISLRYVNLDAAASVPTTGSTVQPTYKTGRGSVTISVLAIHNAAYDSAYVIDSYQVGTIVDVIEVKGNWGRTDKGWIDLRYVKMDATAAQTPITYTTGMGTVTASSLNIRDDASINGKILGTFKKGHRVEILQVSGNWGRTVKGWVSLKYVKMDTVVTTPSTGNTNLNTYFTTGMATVTADSLNIRYGAGTNYEIVGKFTKGHRVEILQVAGSWGRTVKGWISLKYVEMDSEPVYEQPTYTTGMGTVAVNSLNIRYGAGSNYEIIGSFSKGHRVEILQVAGTWGRTVSGWVNMQYIKMDA